LLIGVMREVGSQLALCRTALLTGVEQGEVGHEPYAGLQWGAGGGGLRGARGRGGRPVWGGDGVGEGGNTKTGGGVGRAVTEARG